MFGLLYFAQGAVLSYFTALNALYLLSHDLEMTQIGVFSAIALLPFVIKIFFGMISDRFNLLGLGHRKPYILFGLGIQMTCLIIAPFIDPKAGYWLFVVIAFILMCGQALYDTCTDGLAIDTTPLEDQGTVQGLMVGGRALGVVLISGVVGLLAEHVSWFAVFWLLALLTLIPVPMVWRVRESARSPEQSFQWGAFGAFKRWPIIALAILGALYSLIINGANELVNPFLREQFDINLTSAGLVTTLWGIGVVAGGLIGGRVTDRIGHHNSVRLALFLALIAILPLGFLYRPLLAWVFVLFFGLAYGIYETVYFAVSMEFTDPHIAASMFALLMAVANVGTGIGLALSGSLVDHLGYPLTFAILAGLNLLALPLLSIIFSQKRESYA